MKIGEADLLIRTDSSLAHCHGWIAIDGIRLRYLNAVTTRSYTFDEYNRPNHQLFDDVIDEDYWIAHNGYVWDNPQIIQVRKLVQDLQSTIWRFTSPFEDKSITIYTGGSNEDGR